MGLILPGQIGGPERPGLPRDSDAIRPIREPRGDQASFLAARARPDSPGYPQMMQAPEADATTADALDGWTPDAVALPPPDLAMQPTPSAGVPPAPAPGAQDLRAVLSFGPQGGLLVVSLERAATGWDVADDETWQIPTDAVAAVLPLLRKVMRVKDLTGGSWRGLHAVAPA